MYFFHKPSDKEIALFLLAQADQSFSYPHVGRTKYLGGRSESQAGTSRAHTGKPASGVPQGYICDHRRTKLGTGLQVFQAGIDAINQWQMFNLGWLTIYGAGQPQAGLNVCVLAHHLGFWSLNACRIVYVIDQGSVALSDHDLGPVSNLQSAAMPGRNPSALPDLQSANGSARRYGFAYGTLFSHAERGEERFLIEWLEDDTVWFDVFAFSLPSTLFVALGLPLARVLQRRFSRQASQAMVEFVADREKHSVISDQVV